MNLAHGGLENLILNAIWNNDNLEINLLSVANIQEKLNKLNVKKKWAYTTVKTVMDRLVDKGLIDRVKLGKKYLYKSIIQKEDLVRKAILKLSKDFFNGDINAMKSAVEKVAAKEQELLVHVFR
ncbi:MAG: BlaI/MecI/CopY family transcriptional regulator [Candidatus Gastranaerophilales bacterium]|nr:BlaI/MecI/CopY family transcriptional regulator [Candidatus Gastranaerophilales bacterium]